MGNSWRTCTEDGMYEVNELGQVRSWFNNRHGRASSPRLLRQGKSSSGYPTVSLWGRKTRTVHTLVAEAFIGPLDGMEVHHKDGNKGNPSLSNLEVVTKAEHDRLHPKPSGESHYQGKLDWQKVGRIRKLRGVVPQKQLAEEYEVHRVTISAVQTGKIWREDA